ncbi:glycosyltransferase [Microbacterium protaetiae]|uniref:Glycosyltransferase n=1 Tax=Microbacterium protaetiae TaxID=2509458 RepID=A0A4P6EPS7_9MICO|nr:glycosyltransferase [Microbacterium protaetiae]QAY59968.1 glycosyltransferase [Microbacterium protaetiae]
MKILVAIAEPYLPETHGGGLLDIHELCREWAKDGHEVTVFAGRSESRIRRRIRRILRLMGWRQHPFLGVLDGYFVLRSGSHAYVDNLSDWVDAEKPDVVVLQGSRFAMLLDALSGHDGLVALRLVTRESAAEIAGLSWGSRDFRERIRSGETMVISNSQFLARETKALTGIDSTVIYPPITVDDTGAVPSRTESTILMVNPIAIKGIDITLEVAKIRPQYQFLLLESWHLDDRQRADLNERIRSLPNVRFERHSDEITRVYDRSSVLFVPSQWQEAFGRVVPEAGARGVPSVYSDRGGLPEAAAGSGVMVDPWAPPQVWADALDGIIAEWLKHSRLATVSSGRPDIVPRVVATEHIELFESARERH